MSDAQRLANDDWSRMQSARIAELETQVQSLVGELARAHRTIKPFAGCVFNDNGDVTIQGSGGWGDYVNAYWTERALKAALVTHKAGET